MKKIRYLFFMLAAGAASAYGQTPPGAMKLSLVKLQLTPHAHLTINGLLTDDTVRALALPPDGPIRTLLPDHMPCQVPDMALVEWMPVKRSRNADSMPNKSRPAPMFVLPPGNR